MTKFNRRYRRKHELQQKTWYEDHLLQEEVKHADTVKGRCQELLDRHFDKIFLGGIVATALSAGVAYAVIANRFGQA